MQVRTDQMAPLSGGVFTMGTDRPFFPADGEGPARKVRVKPFSMDVHEVSNAEFARSGKPHVLVCGDLINCKSHSIPIRFVAATGHKTEAEVFGDSFVKDSYISDETKSTITQVTFI